ncbi:OmpA family protein [Alteromonas sp. CYL-A6]|uniref:OmpA family protein n=1 Tax=Alteromonas nitratireducens TaxID=3390813 RepID=UPI0034AFEA98
MLFLAICIVVGCKSTPRAESSDSTPEYPVNQTVTESIPVRAIERQVSFEQVNISEPEIIEITSEFSTISLSKFKLESHTLYKTELTNDILFQTDSASSYNLTASDIAAVSRIFNTGKVGRYLYVVGHTDSRGDESYNLRLSLRRAMSVATKLVNEGVDVERIKLVPAGEHQPKAKNAPATYSLNRRVDILSADSKALISAFIREQDCTLVDDACKQSELSILNIENDPDIGVVIEPGRYDSVIVAAPNANNLRKLSKDLNTIGIDAVDRRDNATNERSRLDEGQTQVRDTFSMGVIIRDPLIFKKLIRDVLKFDDKYIVK